jgi:hypothetical protein
MWRFFFTILGNISFSKKKKERKKEGRKERKKERKKEKRLHYGVIFS